MAILVHLDEAMSRRGIGLTELADTVGIPPVNLSMLQRGQAQALRMTTLDALCRVLDCQPGELLECVPDTETSNA